MVFPTLSTKKIFFYNFFPTKAEEEFLKATEDPAGVKIHGRTLIEMRDMHPRHVADPDNPWLIKKTLTDDEVLSGKIVMSSNDMFEHVVRHWRFSMASYVAIGRGDACVTVCDVTDEESAVKYENSYVSFMQTMEIDYFVLSCVELIKHREVKVGEVVYLYWDINDSNFKFKVGV